MAMPATRADRCWQEWSSTWPQPSSVYCKLTFLFHPCWLDHSPSTPLLTAMQQQHCSTAAVQPTPSIRAHFVWLAHWQHWFCLFNVSAIYHTRLPHIRTVACGRQDGSEHWAMLGWKVQALDCC